MQRGNGGQMGVGNNNQLSRVLKSPIGAAAEVPTVTDTQFRQIRDMNFGPAYVSVNYSFVTDPIGKRLSIDAQVGMSYDVPLSDDWYSLFSSIHLEFEFTAVGDPATDHDLDVWGASSFVLNEVTGFSGAPISSRTVNQATAIRGDGWVNFGSQPAQWQVDYDSSSNDDIGIRLVPGGLFDNPDADSDASIIVYGTQDIS